MCGDTPLMFSTTPSTWSPTWKGTARGGSICASQGPDGDRGRVGLRLRCIQLRLKRAQLRLSCGAGDGRVERAETNARLAAERELFAHVDERDLLRSSDHHRAVHYGARQVLRDGDVLVRRSRRRVHDLPSRSPWWMTPSRMVIAWYQGR